MTSTGSQPGSMPSWPWTLLPQQRAAPPVVTAQLSVSPTVMALMLAVSVGKSTGVVPKLPPQHFTPPAVVTAQVTEPINCTSTTVALSPTTSTGARRSYRRRVGRHRCRPNI